MFKKNHPTWFLMTPALSRWINANFNTSIEKIALSTLEVEKVESRENNTRLLIPRGVITDMTFPAPIGQVGEVRYQLQQPVLFGAITMACAPLAQSPWRAEITPKETVNDDDYRAALTLDQLRVEVGECRARGFSKILIHSAHSHFYDVFTARKRVSSSVKAMVEHLVLDFYARAAHGVFSGGDCTEIPTIVEKALEPIIGKPLVDTLTSIVSDVVEAHGHNPAEMLSHGHRWVEAINTITVEDEDTAMEQFDLRCWRLNQIVTRSAEKNVALLKVKYPPVVVRRQPKKNPGGLQEWLHNLTEDEDEDGTEYSESTDSPHDDNEENDNYAPAVGLPAHRHLHYRQPTLKEKGTAVAVSRDLQKLRYRTPGTTITASQIPHGRLNTRQLVQFTAQRTAGSLVTATPWSEKATLQSDQPGLSCALVIDASWSMAPFIRNLVSLNWVMSQATRTVGGTLSSWGFGGNAFEIVRAGTMPRLVPEVVDTGSNSLGAAEALTRAALDSNLEAGSGARIAIVVTDAGETVEKEALNTTFGLLRESGVATFLVLTGAARHDHGITNADIIDCTWSEDLAPMLTEKIMETYASI